MAKKSDTSSLNYYRPSRNHLIIIAALIGIACISAGFALALASQYLDPIQKWILIAFSTIFPTAGLALCAWLIIRHGSKLAAARESENISWQLMMPETQRRKMNSEVKELAAVLGIPAQQVSDLRSAYLVAEDLALRQIEQETKVPLHRHVSVDGAEFDAIMVNGNIITCVEVLFLVTSHVSQEKINTILKKIDYAGRKLSESRPGSKFRLLLALVTQLDQEGETRLRSTLIGKFSTTPVDVDIRLLDFEGLQKIFAAD